MTKNNLYHMTWKLRATGALVLALALSTFPAAFSRAVNAQTPAKATAQTPAKTTASPAGESKGGQREGIKVHGHWTINVRNPDGALVTHREFENALTDGGAAILALVMGRSQVIYLWKIVFLASTNSPSPWLNGLGVITEPNDSLALPNDSKNLSLCTAARDCIIAGVLQPTPPPENAFLLSGSITAQQNGTIGNVSTAEHNFVFTAHTLAPLVNGSCPPNTQCVVNVVAGQIIQVTVVISFS